MSSKPTFLYKADPERGREWQRLFAAKAPALQFRLWPDVGDPAAVRYLAAWEPPQDIVRTFPNLELLFSVGAGVDQFDFAALPASVPVVRMVEPGIVAGMVEYVTLAVLALHRDLIDYCSQQRRGEWRAMPVRPAASRRVGVLGVGVLGRAALEALVPFGFPCAGWSRTRRAVAGIECFAGAGELAPFLARTDILVCLLPLTAQTCGFLDRRLLDALPRGAALVNTGRGAQLIAADLLDALDEGHLSAAFLDVCDPEPPPPGHPFWTHPRIWMTPHVASVTQPATAVEVVLDNIRRHESGEPLVGLIDRDHGY